MLNRISPPIRLQRLAVTCGLLLSCLSLSLSAQVSDPRSTPQTVEQSIEALMGPKRETTSNKSQEKGEPGKAAPKKSTEPTLYISDSGNGRIVIMQGINGENFSALGLPGYGFGRFLRPSQLWVDHLGRLYVADSGNDRVVRVDQNSKTGWQELGGLKRPTGVAVDKSGIYISDTEADRVVRVADIDKDQKIEEVISHSQLTRPGSLWIDKGGALYICAGEDPPGGKVFKTWMDDEGRRRWKIYEGEGLSGSRFLPVGVVTARNKLHILDGSSHRLVETRGIHGKRSRERKFRRARKWRLSRPQGLAVDSSGKRLFIADSGNDRILELINGVIVGEFKAPKSDPTSGLRNPGYIFVHSPAPAPEPEKENEGEE